MKPQVPLGLVIGQLVRGGAERQLHALVRGMDQERFSPVVFCLSDLVEPYGPRLEDAGAAVVTIPRRGHYDFLRALTLARELRRRGIRLVHAFLLEATVYAAIARTVARTPALLTSNRVALPGRDGVRRAFDRWAFATSDRVVVNSEAVRRFTARTYRIAEDRMEVIYNGIDPTTFLEARRDEELRAVLGAGSGELLIATVGRVMPQKNPELFLDVARRVHEREPRARFTWIGTGSLASMLSERIRELGLEGIVSTPGPRDDVPAILASCDLFLLTSDAEGLPNVILEAMAAGLGVVATDAGGTGEALGETGIVCPRGDGAGLAAAILGLLQDPGGRAALGEAARARVREHFSIEAMVSSTQRVYEEVLRDKGSAA